MEVKGPVSCAIEWRIAPTFGGAPSPTFLPGRWNETTGAVPIVVVFSKSSLDDPVRPCLHSVTRKAGSMGCRISAELALERPAQFLLITVAGLNRDAL